MLLKFDAVEEIGRFAVLRHKAEPFSRLSLVFARNGFGKSTLCAVVRSASNDQPNYIAARRRLGAKNESRVQSTWSNGTVAFGSGKWNSCPGKVYVFDQEFAHQNLHVGESVTRENKRSLLPVVLGDQGVSLARKILDLDREQRELATATSKSAAVIYAKCPVVTSADILAFCQKDIPTDIALRMESSERAVQLAKQVALVQSKAPLRVIELPSLDYFKEICRRTMDTVSDDVGERIRRHIEAHQLGPQGDRWLKYGVDRLADDTCPFCDQNTSGVDIVEAYNAYFSAAFAQLLTDRDGALAALDALLDDGGLRTSVRRNEEDSAFWAQVCPLPAKPSLTVEQLDFVIDSLEALRALLREKVANPLKIVSFGDRSTSFDVSFALLDAYNQAVTPCVSAVETAKADARDADLAKAERIRSQWVAFTARQTEPIKTAANDYARGEARRKEIEREKKIAQDALTTYADAVMSTRQDEINALLSAFGANFQIANAKANFKGREPNTDYAILIGKNNLAVGEKSETEPSFKTVLSTGDKTTLALAFFISQVRADPRPNEAIIIFDDPFNSQDMNRQFETTSQIRAIARNACQTIVLSHDPRFLNAIEKDADGSITRTFQLLCSDSGQGSISPWSSATELKSLYIRQAEMIREFAGQGIPLKGTTIESVVQAIRPFLEDYIKARFPGRFAAHEQIVPMTDAIRQAGQSDPLFGSVEDLLSLNEYTRVNMHGGGQAPDPVALRAQAKKVVAIVGKY